MPLVNPAAVDEGVEVWHAELADSDSLTAWEALLDASERDRARRFHFPRDQRRFVYGRGLLRCVLASHLELDPRRLQFQYSPEGKPELFPGTGQQKLHFNISHSGTKLLLAMAKDRRVGVDVEQLRTDIETEQIAGRFFSFEEQTRLRSLEKAERIPGFFRCWTRKEAYVKAMGKGLSLPLSRFDVSLEPGEPAALLATRPDPLEATRWILGHLDVGDEYAAAVAVERSREEPVSFLA